MNNFFSIAFLLAFSLSLFGKEHGFIDKIFEGAVDLSVEEAKNKKEELIDQLGQPHGSSLIKDGVDYVIDAAVDKLKESVHEKKTDPHWFRSSKNEIEPNFNDSIDQFFRRFNSECPSISLPLEIHFFGSKATPDAPLLESGTSQITVPAFSLEERPIDYTAGGLQAAKNMEKALVSARSQKDGVYRHLVGLETTSPLMASAIKQIVTWANQLNAMSIHSYDMAAALSPGMWPKIQRGASYACEHEKIANGYDLIEAKTLCQDKTVRDRALKSLSERNDRIFAGSFNVADKVLTQMGVGKAKKILMNMTGTLVSKNSEEIEYFPPLHRAVIALLRDGREIETGYRMKGHGIEIERGAVCIDQSEKARILDLFKSIQKKLREDADFNEEEKSLLGSSHFPMSSFITLMTQYRGSGTALILERYSDLIAFERVVQFMEEAAQSILHKAESLRAAQISGFELEAYIKQVGEVLFDLRNLKKENLQKIANEQKALDSLIQIDRGLRERARSG